MRSIGSPFHLPVSKIAATRESYLSAAAAAPAVDQSPWGSPVPYLFAGLAAMIGLIAFALLILACAYWKLIAGGEERGTEAAAALAAAEKSESSSDLTDPPAFEEKFLVIMAGEMKPTFLATPVLPSRAATASSSSSSSPETSNLNQNSAISIPENGESPLDSQSIV